MAVSHLLCKFSCGWTHQISSISLTTLTASDLQFAEYGDETEEESMAEPARNSRLCDEKRLTSSLDVEEDASSSEDVDSSGILAIDQIS